VLKKSQNNYSLKSLPKNLIHPTENAHVVDKTQFNYLGLGINLFGILSKFRVVTSAFLRVPEQGDRQQFTAIKSIAVWENVWQGFGICHQTSQKVERRMGICMATQSAAECNGTRGANFYRGSTAGIHHEGLTGNYVFL